MSCLLPNCLILLILTAHRHGVFAEEDCSQELSNLMPRYLSVKVVPISYSLTLAVNLDSNNFGGHVTIEIDYNLDTPSNVNLDNYIYLHAFSKLEIVEENTNVRSGGRDLMIKSQCRNRMREYWVIELEAPLSKGQHSIELEFVGNMDNNADLDGLYKGRYVDAENNEEGLIVANKFHRANARRTFPCFDEPRFKTEFNIQIIHPNGYQTLCSFDTSSRAEEPGMILTICHTKGIKSPVWLIGWNINQFTKWSKTRNDIAFQIWSRPEFAKERKYAFDIVDKVVEYLEKFTRLPYPLKKLDLIALPALIFGSNGMDQWGLLTFREPILLWRKLQSTIESKLEITRVICHEMSHQWFANRVSIKYWRDEWLNEGMATWIQFKCVDDLEPSWRYIDERLAHALNRAYLTDALNTASPLVSAAHWSFVVDGNPHIVYSKGAAVLFMIEDHIGPRKFQNGIETYLKEHDGGVVETSDLWKGLQSATKQSKVNIAPVYNTWVTKAGYPYVTVTRQEHQAVLVQKRLLSQGHTSRMVVWSIPVKYYKNGKIEFVLFNQEFMPIPVAANDSLKLNVEHRGFYVSTYDDWSQLSSVVGSDYLKAADYGGLILDIIFLTHCQKVTYRQIIGVVGQVLNASDHHLTWRMGKSLIIRANEFMKITDSTRQKLFALVNSWLDLKYNSEMWIEKGKSVPQIRLSTTILSLCCDFGHQRCLEDGKKHFDDWRHRNTQLSANIREFVYKCGLKASDDEADLKFVWQRYEQAVDDALVKHKTELRTALSYVRNPNLVNKYLDYIWNRSTSDLNDHMTNIANNPDAVNAAWVIFHTEFDALRQEMRLTDDQLGKLIITFAKQFTAGPRLQEIARLVRNLQTVEQPANTYFMKAVSHLNNNKDKIAQYENDFTLRRD